jgi:hypothetical protein
MATIVRRPLAAADVGPAWIANVPTQPSGGGCRAAGCALQAEKYTSILDPDADGLVWTKVAVPEALGGQVIKAPGGSIVSLPGTQETVATYDMTFQAPGTYTAYYRVRGFNGSSDSIYTPDGFAVDPDNSLTTDQDGTFIWKKDSHSFTITPANVGVPLEFRLSMREPLAEIDALVLNLSSSLTSAQLDALFTVLPGDYNGDNIVDSRDYVLWRNTLGSTSQLAADGNGDGVVNQADYDIWRTHFGSTPAAGAFMSSSVPEPSPPNLVTICSLAFSLMYGRARVEPMLVPQKRFSLLC